MYLQTVLRLNSEDSLHYDGRHGIMTHNLDYVLSSLFSGLKRCCERKLCLGDLALSPDGTGNDCVKCFTVLFFAWELTATGLKASVSRHLAALWRFFFRIVCENIE